MTVFSKPRSALNCSTKFMSLDLVQLLWEWKMPFTIFCIIYLLVGCGPVSTTSGLLPLQMLEKSNLLVAAEVHFFDETLDLKPLRLELKRVDDYLIKKRYRYVIYEPSFKNNVSNEFVEYSSHLQITGADKISEIVKKREIETPDLSAQKIELSALNRTLAPYLKMVTPYKKALEQLESQKQYHLEAIVDIERQAQQNFNLYKQTKKWIMPDYHFTLSAFNFKKKNKLDTNCDSIRNKSFILLSKKTDLDNHFCWYLQLPDKKFVGTSAAEKHQALFVLYYPHYQAISEKAAYTLLGRIDSAQKAYDDIELEARTRFNTSKFDIERYILLTQLLENNELLVLASTKVNKETLRIKNIRQMAERYKATLTLYYLFNHSISSKVVAKNGRFEIPSKAKFMLVYGLYGPNVQDSKEYFWFIDMKQKLQSIDNIDLMTLPEKPVNELLGPQLDIVIP